MIRWAQQNTWQIAGPEKHSYRGRNGKSSPGIFLVKGMEHSRVYTKNDATGAGSDHHPVQLMIRLDENGPGMGYKKHKSHIPRRHRRNASILGEAKKHFVAEPLNGSLQSRMRAAARNSKKLTKISKKRY